MLKLNGYIWIYFSRFMRNLGVANFVAGKCTHRSACKYIQKFGTNLPAKNASSQQS